MLYRGKSTTFGTVVLGIVSRDFPGLQIVFIDTARVCCRNVQVIKFTFLYKILVKTALSVWLFHMQ